MAKEYELPILKCKRCAHTWIPRHKERPKVCPVCKRSDWEGKEE